MLSAAPVLTVNTGLSVGYLGHVSVSSASLFATDADNLPSQLTYTLLTASSQGVLKKGSAAIAAGGTFTQQDIIDGKIQYISNVAGSTGTSDSFAFSVTDPDRKAPRVIAAASMPSISADGRYVAFQSNRSNLVQGDTNGRQDVFVRDMLTGRTVRASLNSKGNQANGDSYAPSISADGRYVAFYSRATNLVPRDTNTRMDVFVRDMRTGRTVRVSVDSKGIQASGYSHNPFLFVAPSISADGRYVAFDLYASNLVSGDTNRSRDVFVHDLQTHQTVRVSVDSNGNQANGDSYSPSISADGRYVAFNSYADNLVPDDTNNRSDIFVRDLLTGLTKRVSVDSSGNQANNDSFDPSITADGRYAAYYSYASNLVASDTNNHSDVFVCDMQTGITTRVSVDSNGYQANNDSSNPTISADGRFVMLQSDASNLALGDTNNLTDVFVRDMLSGKTTRISPYGWSPTMSVDGQRVVYTVSGNLWVDDIQNASPLGVVSIAINPNQALADSAFSIAENNKDGAPLGAVIPTAVYKGQKFAFVNGGAFTGLGLSGAGAANFAIDSLGNIAVGQGVTLNYESQSSYTFQVTVADRLDATTTYTADVVVNVKDVNEKATFVLLDSLDVTTNSLSISKSALAANQAIGKVVASDPDAAAAGEVRYVALPAASLMSIDADGTIRVKDPTRLTAASTISLTISEKDGSASPLTSTFTFTINVSA